MTVEPVTTHAARDARGEHPVIRRSVASLPGGVRLVRQAGWVCLTSERPTRSERDGRSAEQSLRGWLGRPGLGRAGSAAGEHAEAVFELPADLLDVSHDEDEDAGETGALNRLEQAQAWAVATVAGRVPQDWAAPPEEQVRAWAPPNVWTVERGSVALQGRLAHSPQRLAISYPLLTGPLPELPPRRTAWLHAVLADAQRRWRMARIGIDGSGSPSGIEAEIDLTGAPADLLEPLFRRSLTVLQYMVRWLAPSIALIVDRDAGAALDGLVPAGFPEGNGDF